MVRHGGSSTGSYLADPTSPIPSHCASIVTTSTLRVNIHNTHKVRPRNEITTYDNNVCRVVYQMFAQICLLCTSMNKSLVRGSSLLFHINLSVKSIDIHSIRPIQCPNPPVSMAPSAEILHKKQWNTQRRWPQEKLQFIQWTLWFSKQALNGFSSRQFCYKKRQTQLGSCRFWGHWNTIEQCPTS